MRRLLFSLLTFFALASLAFATPQMPVFSLRLTPSPAHPGEVVVVAVTASMPKGTHIYGLKVDANLFTATKITIEGKGLLPLGTVTEPAPKSYFSKADEVNVDIHDGDVTFYQALQVPKDASPGSIPLNVQVEFQACDEEGCLSPTKANNPDDKNSPKFTVAPVVVEAGEVRAEYAKAPEPPAPQAPSQPKPEKGEEGGLLTFVLTAFGAGLLALLTPCVFPMVPVTFAYFTKLATAKGEDSSTAQKTVVRLAVLYCLGIIISFVLFGLIMAVTVGAAGATAFAANPIVNIGFGLVFIGFGLALLEVVEIRLPSKVQDLTGAGRKTGGALGVFLLGLTFVIASFTCAAPFVGTVMVLAASGKEWFRPILGMALFAFALALPFFLLALFPSLLKKLPKSGDWLTTLKGVMGFLELAAAVKFFSNADLVWEWELMTVPMCLALYGLSFLGCGLWLIGKLYLGFNTPQGTPTPARRIWSGIFIALAIYFIYGTSGRPLNPVLSGFLPPADYGFATKSAAGELEWVSDLEKAKAEAKQTGKRLVLDFTGHTCTNCRYVESKVFPEPAVKTELEQLVRVRLYTDSGRYATPEEGKRNLELALKLTENLVNPLYAVIDADGNLIAKTDYNLAQNPAKMAAWLKAARG